MYFLTIKPFSIGQYILHDLIMHNEMLSYSKLQVECVEMHLDIDVNLSNQNPQIAVFISGTSYHDKSFRLSINLLS